MSYIEVNIDAMAFLSDSLISDLNAACEDLETRRADRLILKIQNATELQPKDWPNVAESMELHAVNRWEKVLRRIERVPATTVSLASGQCNSLALELLLVTDYRLAVNDLCIRLATFGGVVWPGMALHRLVSRFGSAGE